MRKLPLALVAILGVLALACERGTADPPPAPDPTPTRAPEAETSGGSASAGRPYTLMTHCGLGYPTKFRGRYWLPVDGKFRNTINPPPGFGTNGLDDRGILKVVDQDTFIYTSSEGVRVEYEPTDEVPGGCD